MLVGCISVILVVLFVIYFVYDCDSLIFDLVSNVWVGFGVVFGLFVLISLYWKCMNL